MKYLSLIVAICCVLSACASQEVRTKAQRNKHVEAHEAYNGPVCMFEGKPQNMTFVELGKVLAIKETYGEVSEVMPALAKQARKLGANAVMNVESRQRFRGLQFDKIATPFARGVAISIQEPFVCPGKEL